MQLIVQFSLNAGKHEVIVLSFVFLVRIKDIGFSRKNILTSF